MLTHYIYKVYKLHKTIFLFLVLYSIIRGTILRFSSIAVNICDSQHILVIIKITIKKNIKKLLKLESIIFERRTVIILSFKEQCTSVIYFKYKSIIKILYNQLSNLTKLLFLYIVM